MTDKLHKRPGEARYYIFDFSEFPEIEDGAVLTGTPVVTATSHSGSGTAPTVGSPALVTGNKKVSCLLSAGTEGTYLMKCTCATDGGSTLVCLGLLNINER